MADIKISELPVATTVADADVLVVNQGGVTKQAARSLVNAASGTLGVANGGTGRTAGNYSIYGLEIHVGKDGNDTTGDGTLINPVLTITKALTLIGGGRNTIVVHPGGYSESPTVSGTNTTITTTELTGANTLLSGTLTLNAAARVSGLKMSNLTITGTGNTYISNCTVDVNVTKSGSNYVEIINSELQCTSGIQITGTGTVSIVGNKCWAVAVSNAAANVLIKDCFQVIAPSVTAGTLQLDGCAIFGASPSTNAVSSSAGTAITLANSFVLNSVGANVERVSLLGSYSILNLVYDKANSTLTGTNLNAIDYFSVINADTLNLTNDLSVANGGTGASTQQAAINALAGATTSAQFLRGNGTNVVMSAIQAGDVPTLNQNTTGTAAGLSATLASAGGGTGQSTYTDGQLLIGNTAGGLTKATLTAGSNVTITNGDGSISIAATGVGGGVTSFAGGTTGLTPATATTGAVSLGGTLAIANGGTNAINGTDALANLGNTIFPVTVRQFTAMPPATSTATTMTFAVGAGIGGTAVIDGVTLVQGDSVLLLNNADQTQRGPWVITTLGTASVAAVLTRPSWFTTGTAKSGTLCQVQIGTTAAGYILALASATSATTAIVIGTTSISANQIWGRVALATTGTNLFTAYQSFRANGTAANSAPFFFQAGAALMTTPQAHAVEWFNDTMFLTTAAGVRTINPSFINGAAGGGTVPATNTTTGIVGQMAFDATGLYVCTATNTWRRVAWTAF